MSDSPRSDHQQNRSRARQYSRARIGYFVAGLVFSWIGSGWFLFSGSARRLTDASGGIVKRETPRESLTISVFLLLSWLASFPLSYLRGYRLEHQFDLSNQTRVSWFVEQLKGLALQLTLMVPLSQAMLAIIRRRPNDWWVVISALAIPFTVVLAHLFPKLIAPIFNTYQPLRDRELAERLKALAARSGIHVADIMEMDMSRQTKAANAFFTGIGSTRRIVLADTLINEFSYEEIETIVAHEVGHQAHHDLWRLLALGTVATTAIAWTTHVVFDAVHPRTRQITRVRGAGYAEALPLLGLIGSLAGMVIMPVQNAVSRYIERQADDYALELTESPEAFASALNRLKDTNLADPDPSRLEHILLHSHPTISERIETCERFARKKRNR